MSECSFLGFTLRSKKIRWTDKVETDFKHGASSKSYWHVARTPAVQQALSNAWLKAQGPVSVKELWCKAQGYTA